MELIGLLTDLAVVILLIWTIIVAGRLARNMYEFNRAKKELNTLMTQISTSVTHADTVLRDFKNTANQQGKILDKKISEAKMLSDELELIYQSSNRVADRLEKLTETSASKAKTRAAETDNSPAAEKKSPDAASAKKEEVTRAKSKKPRAVDWVKDKIAGGAASAAGAKKTGPFAIRDPEFESDLKEEPESWDGPDDIESEAERALYKALKGRKN